MKQAVISRYGPPEVIQTREAPDPIAAAGQVKIAVRAAGVNFADVMARLGLYPDAPKPPMVVGYEVAGVVDSVGTGVTDVRPGDRVFALTRFGGYASAAIAPAESVFKTPARLSDVEAAAIPVNYLTALIALYRMSNITKGETVLIYGAGGGVGVAATQLAKARGAIVIGTASTTKIEAIKSLGVDHAIDHRTSEVADEVRRITSGRGADVILDAIGGKNLRMSYALLAPLGRLVIYGVSSLASGERRNILRTLWTIARMPAFWPLSLMNQNRAVLGLNVGHLWGETAQLKSAMDLLVAGVDAGQLRPVIAQTFPLERAADAHRYLQSRSNIGKVVLTVQGR
jgi:NADPH:quinone reductase-like Zn-dependent oxidoreductase